MKYATLLALVAVSSAIRIQETPAPAPALTPLQKAAAAETKACAGDASTSDACTAAKAAHTALKPVVADGALSQETPAPTPAPALTPLQKAAAAETKACAGDASTSEACTAAKAAHTALKPVVVADGALSQETPAPAAPAPALTPLQKAAAAETKACA